MGLRLESTNENEEWLPINILTTNGHSHATHTAIIMTLDNWYSTMSRGVASFFHLVWNGLAMQSFLKLNPL